MLDWLLLPIDVSRPHEVGFALSWHARIMVMAWGVLCPLAIFVARFGKILPWQDWPRELDNQFWWRSHYITQTVVLVLSVVGVALVLVSDENTGRAMLHRVLGYVLIMIGFVQVVGGVLRGSKGGPTCPRGRDDWSGDHYDMSVHRLLFERIHKVLGYAALVVVFAAVVSGLWEANAPRWMWIFIIGWWSVLLLVGVVLQLYGRAFDTYQAIWGPDVKHPGNRLPIQGWGVRRPGENGLFNMSKERDNVRRD